MGSVRTSTGTMAADLQLQPGQCHVRVIDGNAGLGCLSPVSCTSSRSQRYRAHEKRALFPRGLFPSGRGQSSAPSSALSEAASNPVRRLDPTA